jgi:uncharacterized protein YgiM (DUF1202 family)
MPRFGSISNKLSSIRLAVAAAATVLALSAAAPVAFAQVAEDPALKEVENSKFSTAGIITSNAVYVRCGPGDNYYPTMKLDKGAKVTVVGAKFDWLKVVPPDGSFCYVARLYIDRHGDGSVGRVNKDAINVRAGSALSALKIGILCELAQGEQVEILGEEQEYFKIKPPAKAYLYINKKFVEPDPDAKPQPQVAKTDAGKPVEQPKTADQIAQAEPRPANPDVTGAQPKPIEQPKPEQPKPIDTKSIEEPRPNSTPKPDTTPTPDGNPPTPPLIDNTPRPNDQSKPDAIPTGPGNETTSHQTPVFPVDPATTIKPKVVEQPKVEAPKPEIPLTPEQAEAAYDQAEAKFLATRALPISEQPIEELTKQYTSAIKAEALPESMRRVAENRLAILKARAAAKNELANVRAAQEEARKRQMALEAEQQELQKRIAENTVKVYTAVGTLQASSLQVGPGPTLYRITDPATGRTVCYIRSNDPKTVNLLGQFVGVKGQLGEEARLGARVVTPTEVTACDPALVHTKITAAIIPPSLQPKEPATATTDPEPQQ